MGNPVRFVCFAGTGATVDVVRSRLSELGFQDALAERDGDAEYCIAFISDVDAALIAYIEELSQRFQLIVVLIPGSNGAADPRWELLNAGAMDVLDWSVERALPEEIAARLTRWIEIARLVESDTLQHGLVGVSPCWKSLKRKLVEAAAYSLGNVLLIGETGTGKEQIARAIHKLSMRAGKPELIVVDCTTLSPELSGSELFGHERGAFTGAITERDGAFALANGGSLFLDEIGELPLQLQAQLLRVIQERTYKRVGGNVWNRTEFRLICASNRDLEKLVAEGGFRGDLYYRIADWVINPPPLRERRADILPLARHFLTAASGNAAAPEIEPALADYLVSRDYPGNVRDLRRLVMRLHSRHVGKGPITIGALPLDDRPVGGRPPEPFGEPGFLLAIQHAFDHGIGLKEIGRAVSNVAINLSLEQERGNLQRAARRLGITDRALQLRRASHDQAAGGGARHAAAENP